MLLVTSSDSFSIIRSIPIQDVITEENFDPATTLAAAFRLVGRQEAHTNQRSNSAPFPRWNLTRQHRGTKSDYYMHVDRQDYLLDEFHNFLAPLH
jgi:hypothetical protein